MSVRYTRELGRDDLARAVATARSWADVMRGLGLKTHGGHRRFLQRKVAEHGLDTGHFTQRAARLRYTDEALADAVASSATLREVALALGAVPATGTLSHLGRRIAAAGIDTGHFAGLNRIRPELPFTAADLRRAAAAARSVRELARALRLPDDGRWRAALRRALTDQGIDTTHFRNARMAVPEGALRAAVGPAVSYADVVRALGLEMNHTNHRRVRRWIAELRLDTSHFTRRPWGSVRTGAPRAVAADVLVVLPHGSPRTNRRRLHRALEEIGVPCRCASCGNPGEWLGRPITLQIDHVNGDWLDNRAENLRYLCPNCHALTDTWCRKRGDGGRATT
ncbi:HNH endonuclease signature motif containing protein [Streptomyces sp. NPDC059175]|uniref:HNH endonuclease signature motif containing protein n=1 Tax=Streptomyces sp. NPDC059175 TaxID=3346757 RepID=UPI0036AC201C